MHLWSDGCASHFRSRFVFILQSYQVVRYYNDRHRGKGPMDGIGDCVKNVVFRAVLSEKAVIHSPGDFAHSADSKIKGVSVVFMPKSDTKEEPDFIRETPYIESMCTLKIHLVKSFNTKAGFCYLQFF